MARWYSCNILHPAPEANRLWQFDARKSTLNREHSGKAGQPLPDGLVAKSWNSLWQPRLNVAWLPPEQTFLRVVELPASSFGETLAMVELQLEKLSPLPVTQIVWTIHLLPETAAPAPVPETAPVGKLQQVIVVIIERRVVEEFLGKLEAQGYFTDRLEVPMLDQLVAWPPTEDGAWVYPLTFNSQSAALVAWWYGGILRSLSYVVLPLEGDRVKSLKDQLAQLVWAGEMEGWLQNPPAWHLVAEGAPAGEWETFLQQSLGELVRVSPPLPGPQLAAGTARRAVAASPDAAVLLPAEFSTRYREQWIDRLWLRGLAATGIFYAALVLVYFCATYFLGRHTEVVEASAAALSGSYTNTLQLRARAEVLKQREDLKFAALDCWKLVSEQFPEGITLQRLAFSDGQKLSLAGTTTSDQITTLLDLNNTLHAAALKDSPMFLPDDGNALKYQQNNDKVTWNISLTLAHAEEVKP